MKIVKPLRLGLLSRPYTMRRRRNLGLSVLALASLQERALLHPEPDLWTLAGEVLGEDGVLDLGVPKPCAEFLVSGCAYTAHQRERDACLVQARVGALDKRLMVFGDRYWLDGQATQPQPFDAMPLDWAHAYGGPSFPDNPHGRGADEEDVNGVRTRRLPNVESPEARIRRPGDKAEPAGFGAVSPMWPRRFQLAGRYYDGYLDDGFPGFLDTLDPQFFNAAAVDQRWPQPEIPSGAPYDLWNLHPQRQCVAGALPRWQARCFVRRAGADEQALEEARLRLTTAWFFPDRERVLLIYQGALDVEQDDGSDVEVAMPALEHEGRERPLSHYAAVMAQRLDLQDGALYALRDKDLLPQDVLADWDALRADSPLAQPFAVNQRARGEAMREHMRQRAHEQGVDFADFDVEIPQALPAPGLDDLPDMMRHMRQAEQEARIDMLHAQRRIAESARAQAASMPPGLSPDTLLDAANNPGSGGPPSLQGHPSLAALQELARNTPLGQGESALDAASMAETLRDAQHRLGRLYLSSAHHQPAAAAARPARAARLRRRVQALMSGSRDLSGLDLTGADLSGLDLSGARCVGTWLESADLSGTVLDGADLTEAVLTRVQAAAASWRGARLDRANLGQAVLADIDLSGARLAETVLDALVLERCNLARADLAGCHFGGARLQGCDFEGASLDTVTFWQQAALQETGFAGAQLARVTWLDCELDGVAFAGARLLRCAWVQSRCASPPDWSGAELLTCCAVETDLSGAVFAGAVLRECSLRDTVLEGADFTGATLQRCDLSGCALGGASLARARAEESLFIGADLTGASLAGADLMGALLQKAAMTHADLRDANLFRADLGQALLDDTTDTRGAYTHLANTRPRADRQARP